jgi:hypothetical protein
LQVVRTIEVPPAPHEIISPNNDVAYVSCTKSGKIAAISLSDWSIKKLIDAGNRVDGLGWASLQRAESSLREFVRVWDTLRAIRAI